MKGRFRHRLYPTLPASPLDPWCRRGLAALALLGGTTAAYWMFAAGGLPLPLSLILVATLLALPRWINRSQHWIPTPLPLREIHLGLVVGVLVGLPWLYPTLLLKTWWMLGLVAVHGFALSWSKPDSRAVLALFLPVVEVCYVCQDLWPQGRLLQLAAALWVLLTLAATATVGAWIHARSTRRRLLKRDHDSEHGAETTEGLWQRAGFMARLVVLLVPVVWLLHTLAGFAVPLPPPEVHVSSTGTAMSQADEAAAEEVEAQTPIPSLLLSPSISWQGRIAERQYGRAILQVKSQRDQERSTPYYSEERPLYLMSSTLDRLTAEGMERSPQVEIAHHSDDGLGSDDWILLRPDLLKEETTQFRIRMSPLLMGRASGARGRSYLLHDRTLAALRIPRARVGEDGTATAITDLQRPLSYAWLSSTVPSGQAIHPPTTETKAWLALPEDERFAPWIQQAQDLCAELEDPEQKLARVVHFFRTGFEYDLHPSPQDGFAAFEDFLQHRRGYCSFFAAGSMLFLRANSIPCRVVTGFMVTRWSEAGGFYVAGADDAHAWLEVLQADGSWRRVEPTPPASRAAAMASLTRVDSADELDLSTPERNEAVAEDTAAPAAEAEPSPHPLLRHFQTTSGMLLAAAPLLLLAFLLYQLARSFLGRVRARRQEVAQREEVVAAMSFWDRIRELLQEQGFPHRPSQTAAEYARFVHRRGGSFFGPLETVTRLVYRVRFGGGRWTDREIDFLEEYEQRLLRRLKQDP